MQLAKSIMLKSSAVGLKALVSVLFLSPFMGSAQSNSPYSRYGLGDLFPNSNMTTRGMGGISAGYADVISVNFSNPASYSSFYALKEKTSSKLQYGRVILDAGLNLENRTISCTQYTSKLYIFGCLFFLFECGHTSSKKLGPELWLASFVKGKL